LAVKRSNRWWKISAGASAWALLACVLIIIVSGWGITQTGIIHRLTGGLVDRRLADAIHRNANIPLSFFFLAHVLMNIRLKISPKTRAGAWLTNIVLIVVGIGLLAVTVYMEYFRLGG
jgi:hypothetical protein